jgi:hypothetical protein
MPQLSDQPEPSLALTCTFGLLAVGVEPAQRPLAFFTARQVVPARGFDAAGPESLFAEQVTIGVATSLLFPRPALRRRAVVRVLPSDRSADGERPLTAAWGSDFDAQAAGATVCGIDRRRAKFGRCWQLWLSCPVKSAWGNSPTPVPERADRRP